MNDLPIPPYILYKFRAKQRNMEGSTHYASSGLMQATRAEAGIPPSLTTALQRTELESR